MRHAMQGCVTQWSYSSGKTYADPFNEVVLDLEVTCPDGSVQVVPAFWAGSQTWTVRYCSSQVGLHRYRTVCSDTGNVDLHDQSGELEVTACEGDGGLLLHGAPAVSADGRHFEHADGSPFFWLADTWWMGLCHRLRWPDEFHVLMADRVSKGFSVIQIVAGLYPDMPYMDERGANEAGYPWEKSFTRINPAYFDMADLRIAALVSAGLVPCIVGCWGYFIKWMGVDKMKQHWRNLVARWGAYPVVWCLAGEATMPYYLSDTRDADADEQKHGWTQIAGYLRKIDPWRRMISIHPTTSGREQVQDPRLLDFDMLQTGHGDRDSIPNTVQKVTEAYAAQPRMPVINSEVCYEGIMEASREEVQRFMFWTCVLSGACGHTYGSNGIWQVNRRGAPYGPSPHGSSWGDRPWTEAYQLPGSGELGLAKKLLEQYEWWRLEPHPEWVEPNGLGGNYRAPYAAGIPDQLIIIYMPGPQAPLVKAIKPGVNYTAFYWDPSTGVRRDLGTVCAGEDGGWQPPKPTIFRDWVLVIERAG